MKPPQDAEKNARSPGQRAGPACGLPRDPAFRDTRWSLIRRAAGEGTLAAPALKELCRLYWFPLFSYARRQGSPPEQAEDEVQGFFADACARNLFTQPDPAQGRLRTFLLTAFGRWRITRWHRDHTQGRGGKITRIPWDLAAAEASYQSENSPGLSPEQIYHRQWAACLLENAAAAVAADYAETGRASLFEILSPVLEGDSPAEGYAATALTLNMTENAVRQAAHRLRQAYRRELTRTLAISLGTTEAAILKDNLAALREFLVTV
jgi:RNA polymerase sigma-70 factor (ECF subfamily)